MPFLHDDPVVQRHATHVFSWADNNVNLTKNLEAAEAVRLAP